MIGVYTENEEELRAYVARTGMNLKDPGAALVDWFFTEVIPTHPDLQNARNYHDIRDGLSRLSNKKRKQKAREEAAIPSV